MVLLKYLQSERNLPLVANKSGNTPLESGIHIIFVVGYGWSNVLRIIILIIMIIMNNDNNDLLLLIGRFKSSYQF